MKKRLGISLTAGVATALLVFGGASPAFAGEWAWGSKNCVGNPAGPYVYTGSGGSGDVTHTHKINGAYQWQTFNNGTVTTTRTKTYWVGITEAASVAGASTAWGSYYCD